MGRNQAIRKQRPQWGYGANIDGCCLCNKDKSNCNNCKNTRSFKRVKRQTMSIYKHSNLVKVDKWSRTGNKIQLKKIIKEKRYDE